MAWMEYLKQQWNEPTRTDHYLMQVARKVLLAAGVNPRHVDDMKIEFVTRKQEDVEKKPMTRKEASDYARAAFSMFVPFDPKLKK
jgi:hypothetical protein